MCILSPLEAQLEREQIDRLLFDFLRTIYLFEKREEARFNLTWQEIFLLQTLRFEGQKRITELAEVLRIPLFRASRLVDRLERLGHLRKDATDKDKRVRYAVITPAGREVVQKVEEFNWTTVKERIDLLSSQELEALVHALPKLKMLLGLTDTVTDGPSPAE